MIGIDLFSGAGGLSLGAAMASIDVRIAVESDKYAALSYRTNHKNTHLINDDIHSIKKIEIDRSSYPLILFGGPPCQGFSISNQKNRNKENPKNWLFKEFVRIADVLHPEWIVFENVKGIVETERGFFLERIIKEFSKIGYTCNPLVLNAYDYGIPQRRERLFLICSSSGKSIKKPRKARRMVTVREAIGDLPALDNGANQDVLKYRRRATSEYARRLRGNLKECSGNLVTRNSKEVLERYEYVEQGGNWECIPVNLMDSYADRTRCHTGIYRRLSPDEPSITVGNYRKSMLIHPWENRGLSVREAARLQSFPDSYVFCGSIGFQQQQVGNAVPPLLAKSVFQSIVNAERGV